MIGLDGVAQIIDEKICERAGQIKDREQLRPLMKSFDADSFIGEVYLSVIIANEHITPEIFLHYSENNALRV